MMRHKPGVAFIISAILGGTPLSASPASVTNEMMAISRTQFQAAMNDAVTAVQARDCDRALAVLDPVVPRISGRDRQAAQMVRLPCLAERRPAEATSLYKELEAGDPANPAIRSMGVIMAASDGNAREAGGRLARLADETPLALQRVPGVVARGIIQNLTEQRGFDVRDRLFIALARADWQPQDRPEMRSGLAQGAIEALLNARRPEEAALLLPRITSPELLYDMAIARHYQPLWSRIEARLGEGGGAAVDRFAATNLDLFASRPDDPVIRRDAARSFLLLGRVDDAVRVASTVSARQDIGEEDVATVRIGAQALAAKGSTDAAIERLRPFAKFDLAKNPAIAGVVIGLAEMLEEKGWSEEALTLSRATLVQGGALSGWGTAWVRRTAVCALSSLGRKTDAEVDIQPLIDSPTVNPAATIEALLCLDRTDDAARLAIDTLAAPDGAGILADQFQPVGTIWAPTPSRLRALWVKFRERPDVGAAFDKAARIIPKAYWPAREPRPVPRVARPDDVPLT